MTNSQKVFSNALSQYLNTTKDFSQQFNARLQSRGIHSEEIQRIVTHLEECVYQMNLYMEKNQEDNDD